MYGGLLWLLPGVSCWETLRGEDENRKWLRMELTACVLSRHGAADLAGSLPRTFAVCGWADSAWAGGWCAKIIRALALSPDLDFVNVHTFCAE